MTLRAGVIVEVVCAGNFYAARSKLRIHKVIGNDGNLAVTQRQIYHFSDEMLVTRIFRVYAERSVCEHGFRARGGDGHSGDGF